MASHDFFDDGELDPRAQAEVERIEERTRIALDFLAARGWEPFYQLDEDGDLDFSEMYIAVTECGFYARVLPIAIAALDILAREHPMTLRGLFYRLVSAGLLPSTAKEHYNTVGRIMTKLREASVVSFDWLVDHVRMTLKPSSWSGLQDYAETCRDAYRKDFWARLPSYVHVFVEKDAMAGVLEPATAGYDVPLSVIRGFVSLSFAHEIAASWDRIEKPIFAYYLGDHDPSGLSLERDLRDKLARYCKQDFEWQRLAIVSPHDFESFDLFPLTPKTSDTRTRWFRSLGFEQCAELDAIPANALRERVERAIVGHIPADEWERLRRIEDLEREQWQSMLAAFNGNGNT